MFAADAADRSLSSKDYADERVAGSVNTSAARWRRASRGMYLLIRTGV
jgi:hypothetical protein